MRLRRGGSPAESNGNGTERLLVRNFFFHICGATIELETRAWFDPARPASPSESMGVRGSVPRAAL